MIWMKIDESKKDWLYSWKGNVDAERGCIGHLRADFGRTGEEFWSSWFDHTPALKNAAFRDELQKVINDARKPGNVLHDFKTMSRLCRDGLNIGNNEYGFQLVTDRYEYDLRCIVRRGDYNVYVYCYDRAAKEVA